MRIITLRRKRGFARQAAEDQQPRIGRTDRRHRALDGDHPPPVAAMPLPPATGGAMKPEELRIALFSGNYNYVRDGANQALNRLVGYLLRQGAQVRIYSPTVRHIRPSRRPATWSACRRPDPGRGEYRCADRADAERPPRPCRVRAQRGPRLRARTSSPIARSAGHGERGIPAVASVHTRFDTYLQYYLCMAGAGHSAR